VTGWLINIIIAVKALA